MAGKRLALLIANAEYRHPELRKLNTPHHDVRALEALLTRPDIGGYQTQVLIDATKGTMERAIDRMLSASDRDDTVLIFFAGHGLKHENGKLYFAATDTEPEFLGATAMSAGWLMEQMQNSWVGRQIVFLDCCFGGAFARGNVWRGGNAPVESGKALEVPGLESEGRGQVVISSADAMQFALEGGTLSDKPPASHFARALTEGLATGEADRIPQDGRITIDELMSYLVSKLKGSGSPQRPTKWTFGTVGGDLLFAYNPRAALATEQNRVSSAAAPGFSLPDDWEEQTRRYFEAKDYLKVLMLLEKAADAGHAHAMCNLGLLYENGLGIAPDSSKACQWYRRAAEAENADAMHKVGWMYQNGRGVAQSYAKAREWYQKAAEAGYPPSMCSLGWLYEKGRGVSRDYTKAYDWYRRAAEAGYAPAQHTLGRLYENGRGTSQGRAEAHCWYEKAAEAGYPPSMCSLGRLYEKGRGVSRDYTKAYDWYRRAAEAGYAQAICNLGRLYERGWGIARDYVQAREWYRKAVIAQSASTMYTLGWLYQHGSGVAPDDLKAREWYQKAAGAGSADAVKALSYLPSEAIRIP